MHLVSAFDQKSLKFTADFRVFEGAKPGDGGAEFYPVVEKSLKCVTSRWGWVAPMEPKWSQKA